LIGGPLNDNLLGGYGADRIDAGAGNDVIWGNRNHDGRPTGGDWIHAGAGDDIAYGSSLRSEIDGGPGDDFLQAGGGRNHIDGGSGDDHIRLPAGGRGPNRVVAGSGNDRVEAYASGRARIDCGPGRDIVRIGFNRRVSTVHCETVTHRWR
jgi:Ca2+-binding RTX toxin-like protein